MRSTGLEFATYLTGRYVSFEIFPLSFVEYLTFKRQYAEVQSPHLELPRYIQYPNWWGTMPMCVYTFLEHYDLTGKKIVPFCTNEGSGMGGSERELKKICKGASVASGLSIHGAEAAQSEGKVAAWAKKNV